LQGAKDVVVDPVAPAHWLESVAATDKTYHQLPEHYHELLNEPDWRQTIELIIEWLDTRIAAHAEPVVRSFD
jgi:alpha-beta hydrolase superfamily lysophospholipase